MGTRSAGMRVAWATDIHLNAVDDAQASAFCDRIAESDAGALLLGGDISEAEDLEQRLRQLERRLARPVYFVLGNHDFYGAFVRPVRERMQSLRSRWLHWLPCSGVVRLSRDTALVGHDGWGDARLGDFTGSSVVLSDFLLIGDLREAVPGPDPLAVLDDKPALRAALNDLGAEAASVSAPLLAEAAATSRRVLFLTHIPPFREACWHKGTLAGDEWLPFFGCGAIGDVLRDVAAANPSCQITVLCGHTHGSGYVRLLPNLEAYTQGARYCRPEFLLLDLERHDFELPVYGWANRDKGA